MRKYRVVRTYPSRVVVAENLSKQEAANKAAIENLGSDAESFSVEEMQ